MENKQLIKIFTDGASRGNPGLAGAGVLIDGLSLSCSLSVFLGKKTNNEAEYLALLLAIRYLDQILEQKLNNDPINNLQAIFYLDSKLVVEQMLGKWKIKDERMKILANKCKALLERVGIQADFIHVKREKNQQADWLANQAIDLANGLN